MTVMGLSSLGYLHKAFSMCTVGGDGGCRVGEVRAGTTPPMPDHKGFKLQYRTNRINMFINIRNNQK